MPYIVLATYQHCEPTIAIFQNINYAEALYDLMQSTTYLYECEPGTSVLKLIKQKQYKGEM